jgi:predicted aspartyl protease
LKNITILILFVTIFGSCSTTKTTANSKKESVTNAIDLEACLMKNNNYAKIPLNKLASGHLHLSAQVNGVKGKFILDTGAGATVVDNKLKNKFKITTEETDSSGAGAGGEMSLQTSLNNSLVIGDLKISKFTLYAMNLDHINGAFTSMGLEEVDGVIGADVLTSNKGIIDYSNLILYLKM